MKCSREYRLFQALAIDEYDADELETDFFLRDPDLKIVSIRYVGEKKFTHIFVTKGNVAAPRLPIRLRDGELSSHSMMSNPDLYVYAEDGKIRGVSSRLHSDR